MKLDEITVPVRVNLKVGEEAEPSALAVLAGYAAEVAVREGWAVTITPERGRADLVRLLFDTGGNEQPRASSCRVVALSAPLTLPARHYRDMVDEQASALNKLLRSHQGGRGVILLEGPCSLCGLNWPHEHTPEQIADWTARGGLVG